MGKTVKALIKGTVISTAYVELDELNNVVKIKQVIDIIHCDTKYIRKL